MAKLVVSQNGVVEGHYFLDKPRFTLGRLPDSDISLNHPGVSNVHAVIITMSNDHILEDMGSTNGTLVNGEKLDKHILQNNDTIELGCYQLKYVNQRANSDMDFDKTMITTVALTEHHDQVSAQPMLATAVSSARAVKTSFPLGGVKYLNGELAGQDILISAPLKTFGRPGQLAMISRRPLGYYVTHVEGRRMPRVNGKTIGTQAVLLNVNDRVEIADLKLAFYLQSET